MSCSGVVISRGESVRRRASRGQPRRKLPDTTVPDQLDSARLGPLLGHRTWGFDSVSQFAKRSLQETDGPLQAGPVECELTASGAINACE